MLLLTSLLIQACSYGGGVEFTVADSAGVMIVTSMAPSADWFLEREPEFSLGVLEGGPAEFYQIRDIAVLPRGRIAVANGGTEEIRFFSMDGEHLGSSGGRGSGPQEFKGLYWITLLGDSILTHDSGNDRISILDSAGTYARSFRMEWHYGIVSPAAARPDRTLLGFTVRHMVEMPHAGLVTDSALLAHYDLDGNMLDSITRFPHNQRVVRRSGNLQTTLGLPYSATGQLVGTPDGFCYVFGIYAEVRCYGLDGRLVRIARLAVNPEPVTTEDVASFWERELALRNERRVQAMRRMRDVMVFPDYFPAFVDLEVDDQGRLWAQSYSHPGEPRVEWLVFESGRWVARLEVDPAFQLMAIRDERVIGVWRDDLGVESVRAYRLRVGTP
jgi:hypothetical protein